VTVWQLVGLIGSVIFGMIVARLLPYIYPIFAARILDVVLGPGVTSTRDSFNSFLMTCCTCSSSFVISFLTLLVFRIRRKDR
jgi:hypothetical protein